MEVFMKIFIGSSSEALEDARFVASIIEDTNCTPKLWNESDMFIAGNYTLENLENIAQEVEAAIFIMSEDDKQWHGNSISSVVRDNVVFELGLFTGHLSQRNVCFCCKGNPKIASDLYGVTYINLDKRYRATDQIKSWLKTLKVVDSISISTPPQAIKSFPNEKQAMPEICNLLRATKNNLKIMSKAGTTIFYLFRDYIELLKRPNTNVQVILTDPFSDRIISYIDELAIGNSLTSQFDVLISDSLACLTLMSRLTDEEQCDLLVRGIIALVRRTISYKQLIIASHITWLIAMRVATYQNKVSSLLNDSNTLKIYYSDSMPRIKAWISDDKICAHGSYAVHALRIDNPVEFYNAKNKDNTSSSQFRECLAEWNAKKNSAHVQEYSLNDSDVFYSYCETLLSKAF